jgi:hypothetical protein
VPEGTDRADSWQLYREPAGDRRTHTKIVRLRRVIICKEEHGSFGAMQAEVG